MAFNKTSYYGSSLNILDSQIGLVTKTAQGTQAMAETVDGRKVIKAGSLFNDTEDAYEAVTPATGANPKESGWYTLSNGTYSLTNSTTVQSNTTYYEKVHTATGMVGVVFEDYDVTDYAEGYPIAVVVQGRIRADRVTSAVVAKKSDLAAQGLYLV